MPPAALPHRLGTTDTFWQLLPDPHDRAADHDHLVALAATALGATGRPAASTAPALHFAQRCPSCDSPDHGRPVVLDDAQHPLAQVSLSRAHGYVALAASPSTALGIDIESRAAVRAAALDRAAFDHLERAAFSAADPVTADRMRAQAWTTKEAILKALGTGLRLDPRAIGLDWPAGPAHPQLARSSDPHVDPAAVTLYSLDDDLPDTLVGTVALAHTGSFGRAFS